MFKKYSVEESVSSTSQVKNSVQRALQQQIVENYPSLADAIETIVPKKSMIVAKAQDGVQLIAVNGEVLFFGRRDGPLYPTLRLVHRYPAIMQRMQVDTGAIRFVLGGANIMCPGFTSPGGSMPTELEAEQPVAIYAQGKENALAIGLTKMSVADIRSVNKGIAVENLHYLMDGLWQEPSLT